MLVIGVISCTPKYGHFTRLDDGGTEFLSLLNSNEFVYERRTGRDKLVARGDYNRVDAVIQIEISSLRGNPLLLPVRLLQCDIQESTSTETRLFLTDLHSGEPLPLVRITLMTLSGESMVDYTDLSGELVCKEADLKDIMIAPERCLHSIFSLANTGYWNIQCGMMCIFTPKEDGHCFGPETLMLSVMVDTVRNTIVDIRQ